MLSQHTTSLNVRYRPSMQLKWQVLILFPCMVPVMGYLLLGQAYWDRTATFLYATVINAGFALVCQLLLDYVSQRVPAYLPGLQQAGARILLLFVLFSVISLVLVVIQIAVYTHGHLFGFAASAARIKNLFIAAGVNNLITLGIFESLYSHQKWRENTLEKEQLKKTNLQSQYEGLKNQINPHFLFNTLNSLSSLILEEPGRAEAFINEMANVYRYLLQSNERSENGSELTSLANEIVFIQSYFHLLKTRYGQGISLQVDIPEHMYHYLLPPLSLQMLVENAIKHNVIHTQMPLNIVICLSDDDRLEVRNNLQPKNSRVLSNGVGLSNISEKYRLLAQQMHIPGREAPSVVVTSSEGQFVVSLPLL
ncbi:sensor histidine kinase [Dyadobacter sandarakinus]|uniref:Histidine kinase n=1 Tax=Dyadobacter sandarakinus TaxID=2747268 RepID=A0ABX7I1P9_9BACT|nr:histidine kinase [Dyadobacter sandarakinus]QRQ99797.1 histidine kinase [Dyadobacter sandarakinus]